MWMSSWCTVCLLCLYQKFIGIFLGEDMLFPYYMVVLFCLYFYICKMGDIRFVYLDALGLWWENRFAYILESIANIFLNYVLGLKYGVVGIASATLITTLIFNYFISSSVIFKKYFNISMKNEDYKRQASYVITMLVCFVITWIPSNMFNDKGFIGLFFQILICLFMPNIVWIIRYYRLPLFRDTIYWILYSFNIPTSLKNTLKVFLNF
jgi:O-antigen/teichoic acid export membrane protein